MNGLFPFGLGVVALGDVRACVLHLNQCAARATAFFIRVGAVWWLEPQAAGAAELCMRASEALL